MKSDFNIDRFFVSLQSKAPGVWGPTDVQAQVHYPAEAHGLLADIENESFWFQHRNKCLLALMKKFSFDSPLFDIGGGNGIVSGAIRGMGSSTVLIEPGFEGVSTALKRGLAPIVHAPIQDLKFKNNSLPAVGLFDVLEHVENDRAFLSTLYQAIVPDGRLYLTVPAYQWLWSEEDKLAGHFRRYNLTQIKNLLMEVGFTMEFASPFFSYLVPAILLFRRLPRLFGFKHTLSKASKDLTAKPNFVLKWIERLELARLSKLQTLPMGSSLLVIARK